MGTQENIMSAIANPSPEEMMNIIVQTGVVGFICFLVVLLMIFVWKFGQTIVS